MEVGEREEEGGTFFNQAFGVQKLQTIQQKRLQRTVLRMVLTSNKNIEKKIPCFHLIIRMRIEEVGKSGQEIRVSGGLRAIICLKDRMEGIHNVVVPGLQTVFIEMVYRWS